MNIKKTIYLLILFFGFNSCLSNYEKKIYSPDSDKIMREVKSELNDTLKESFESRYYLYLMKKNDRSFRKFLITNHHKQAEDITFGDMVELLKKE